MKLVPKDLSEYEVVRQQNIQKREQMMAALMKDFQEFKASVRPPKPKPAPTAKSSPRVKKVDTWSPSPRRNTRSSGRHSPYNLPPPRTRSRKNSTGSSTTSKSDWDDLNKDEDLYPYWLPLEDDEEGEPRPLFFRFGFMKCQKPDNDDDDLSEEEDIKCFVEDMDVKKMRRVSQYYDYPQRYSSPVSYSPAYSPEESDRETKGKRKGGNNTAFDPNVDVLRPEDVTQANLKNVAERGSLKVYNINIGTTCHQCRQKTIDMKTVCRSGECIGLRGMFCGPCLKNRYGEDVKESLLNPRWMCPPCRDLCNCSICRNRNGKQATGVLINIAIARGFSNVKEYLESLIV